MSLDSDDEILAAFSKMEKVSFPQDVMSAYKESGNLGKIEDYLDKFHYTRLLASIKAESRPEKLFESYVRNEIDVRNVASILKLKVEGIYGEEVMEYIIPGGKQVDKRMLAQLANAETIQAAASDLQQLEFYDTIRELVESDDVNMNNVVTGMWRYTIAQAKRFSHLYPLSVIPVLDFMIHKEIEVRNIRTIARGVESGLDKDIIKGLLVI